MSIEIKDILKILFKDADIASEVKDFVKDWYNIDDIFSANEIQYFATSEFLMWSLEDYKELEYKETDAQNEIARLNEEIQEITGSVDGINCVLKHFREHPEFVTNDISKFFWDSIGVMV